ncbi:MAG: type IV toxin-antitoxin system AbiEi family antitoxin domain-containing protein [Actinomycetales bacterium]|nr:type IV toxin-antitoxin system AbiEi family antitoxin domain-containing protein [Actinomycetales bacterium]
MRTADRLPAQPFTPAEAASLGISRATLYRLAERGEIEHLGPGLFQRLDADPSDTDLIEAATRAPQATICLTSALAHHDLVDAIPAAWDLALPRGRYLPTSSPAIQWHSFDRTTFDLGRTVIEIRGSDRQIGLYSPARSIADVFRLRGQEGYEIGVEALREWLRRRGSSPSELMQIASALPRAAGPVRTALEYLT